MEDISQDTASFTSLREGHDRQMDFAPYSPIFYWVGWLFVGYIALYGLAYFIAPAILGYNPPYYGPMGRKRRAVEQQSELARVATNVISQIETFFQDE